MMERGTMSHRFLGMVRLCNLELTAAAVACTGPALGLHRTRPVNMGRSHVTQPLSGQLLAVDSF